MTKARKLCVPRDMPLFPWVSALFSLPGRMTDRRAWHLSVHVTTIVFKHRPLCRFLFLAKISLEMCQIYIGSNQYKRSILAISFEVKYCLIVTYCFCYFYRNFYRKTCLQMLNFFFYMPISSYHNNNFCSLVHKIENSVLVYFKTP